MDNGYRQMGWLRTILRVYIEYVFKFWFISRKDYYIFTRQLSGRNMPIFREIWRVQEEIFDLEQLYGVTPECHHTFDNASEMIIVKIIILNAFQKLNNIPRLFTFLTRVGNMPQYLVKNVNNSGMLLYFW